MSETSTETTTETTATATETATEPDWKAEAEKWKGLARKHEGSAKSNSEAAKKLAEIEQASKSEAERLAEERDREKTRADSEASMNLKLQVALAKAPDGTKPSEVAALAARLTGTSQEELEADADELFRLLGKTGRPSGDVSQGARGGEVQPNANDWIRQQIARA